MKTIQPNARVVLDYTLSDEKGTVLDASDAEDGEPMTYVHGYGMIVPGLEAALVGLEAGAEREVVITPEEGFGVRDEEYILEVDRADFPDPAKVSAGDEMIAESADGHEVPMLVVEVKENSVIVDANHPLAGMTLRYKVKVLEVAQATDEEVADAAAAFDEAGGCDDPTHDHSHAHGPNGHSHAHPHTHGSAGQGGDLVQLKGKKAPEQQN